MAGFQMMMNCGSSVDSSVPSGGSPNRARPFGLSYRRDGYRSKLASLAVSRSRISLSIASSTAEDLMLMEEYVLL